MKKKTKKWIMLHGDTHKSTDQYVVNVKYRIVNEDVANYYTANFIVPKKSTGYTVGEIYDT